MGEDIMTGNMKSRRMTNQKVTRMKLRERKGLMKETMIREESKMKEVLKKKRKNSMKERLEQAMIGILTTGRLKRIEITRRNRETVIEMKGNLIMVLIWKRVNLTES